VADRASELPFALAGFKSSQYSSLSTSYVLRVRADEMRGKRTPSNRNSTAVPVKRHLVMPNADFDRTRCLGTGIGPQSDSNSGGETVRYWGLLNMYELYV